MHAIHVRMLEALKNRRGFSPTLFSQLLITQFEVSVSEVLQGHSLPVAISEQPIKFE